MGCDASRVLAVLQSTAAESRDPKILGDALVRALADELAQASWVGIYWLRGPELVLGPFVGPPTEHTRIPIGRGVCGAAIERGEDRVVDDVRDEENYLACSVSVRSELVVLIRSHGQVVGQIDLDAESVGAFDGDAYCVARTVADAFGGLIEPVRYDPDGEEPEEGA